MGQKLRLLFFLCCLTSFAIGQTYHNEWIDYNKAYYKFNVGSFGINPIGNAHITKGIVRIPYTAITAAGLSGTSSQHFQLWKDGEEVPLFISTASGALSSSDYIEFFGEINSGKLDAELYRDADFQLSNKWSLQTDTAAYFLTVNTAGNNKRFVNTNNNVAANTLPATEYFMHTVGRYFRNFLSNGFFASVSTNLYSSSYDKGEGWMSRVIRPIECGSLTTLPQTFTNLYPYVDGPAMTLRVNAVGAKQNSRTSKITLNNDSITTFQMDYIDYAKVEEIVPISKISSGTANILIDNLSTTQCDEMRVSMIELTYPHSLNMANASVFEFTLPSSNAGHYLKISNFNAGAVAPVLYDISNGKRYEGNISTIDTMQFLLEPSVNAYHLVITTQAGTYYKTINSLKPRAFTNFLSQTNQGDYLIISNPLIYGSGSANYVQQYQQYRSSTAGGSYNAKVIDINDLVDQFAWGVKKHPLSIKNFLKFARNKFVEAPKFTFLVGKGLTYNEYRNNEATPAAEQLNLVPTWGDPASDNLLASDDEKAIPATPIGRLSAVSAQEVGDYLKKVKQYDSAQNSPVFTIESKGWMKNILQITGANDLSLGVQLDDYLQGYKAIISDTAFGAKVTNYSKNADPAGYPEAINSFKKDYENGASLITYFGHSSSTSLDFNLNRPEEYNNQYKYPFFIANGCNAGNNFLFDDNRFYHKSTISESFVLAPERGAIGYLASTHYGVVNYLDIYTRQLYKAMGSSNYNQPIGEIIKQTIIATLDSTGNNDYYSRIHAEQFEYYGDPALKLNSSTLPDYVVEEPQIIVSPSFVSVADTAFTVKVRVNNIGRASSDSVTFKLTRELPNGNVVTVLTKKLGSINQVDSMTVRVPIIGNSDKGINKLKATVDYDNGVAELSDDNNSAYKNVTISENEIRPIFPYNYSIINKATQVLTASTANALSLSKNYVVQLDTTELFNSSLKVEKVVTSVGGAIEFDPEVTYEDGKTYYWRVSSADANPERWNNFSFHYKGNSPGGAQQGHLYQNQHSELKRLTLDSTTKYNFLDKNQNLFVTHSIYPYSGTEDGQFSISVNGSSMIRSACLGASVIFNVFDSLTFKPWVNATQPFNAAANCLTGREYNFEYAYTTAATRNDARSFLNSIPKGNYVSIRLILDEPYETFAPDWAADSLMFGSENTLYQGLKNQGFSQLDSFTYPRTWAFIFKKDDTTFAPSYAMSAGLFDRITLSVNCKTSNVQGYITSPKFGPAKKWKTVTWEGYSDETDNDKQTVDVIGIDNDNNEVVLNTLGSNEYVFSIDNINEAEFPYMRLRMNNVDSVTATPYQLTAWKIEFDELPEGAIAPNLYLNIPDSIGYNTTLVSSPDSLHIGVAFKNVSNANFDSLLVKVILYDELQNPHTFPIAKVRSLPTGDTLHIDLDLDVAGLNGKYNVHVQVNPNNQQPEQFSFNNFLYKYVVINRSNPLPVLLVNFNAILNVDKVNTSWNVTNEVNNGNYEVQHSTNGTLFKSIGNVEALNAGVAARSYSFTHNNPANGNNYYRLLILDKDGSKKFSPVRLVTLGKGINVSFYPNPVKDKLVISVTRPDGKASAVRVLTSTGQQLQQHLITGTAELDFSKLAAGLYLLQVDDGMTLKTYKINKQ